MLKKISKLFLNPKKYFPLSLKVLQQQACFLFQNSAFYWQGQMDINPKSRWYNNSFCVLTGGFFPSINKSNRQICKLEPWDNTRKDMMILLLRTIIDKNISGDMAELGVYKGVTSKLIHYYIPERRLHLFDTFEGFTNRGSIAEQENTNTNISTKHFADTTLESVKRFISPQNENVLFNKGYFPDSIPDDCKLVQFAFVHLDADLYEPIFEGLKFFYPRMAPNGIILVHDYNAWPGARKAVDDFFNNSGVLPIPMPDKSGSVVIVKQKS